MSGDRTFVERVRHAVWPQDRKSWGLYAILLVLVAHAIRYATTQVKDAHTWSDGYYSWLYARSLAFDFDIDMTNDYAVCGDPHHLGADEGGGRPANPYYFGPAVFLGPVIFLVKTVVRFGANASAQWKAGCSGPIVAYGGVSAVIATALTLWICYRVARRWFGELECALGVVIVGVASPLNVHGSLSWYYSHLWAALAVAIAFLAVVRAHETPAPRARWLVAGLGCGLAALMRIQEGLWMLLPLASIVMHAREERDARASGRASTSRWLPNALERALLAGVGFLAVFSIQLVVYQKIYGSPWVVPQGKLYVQMSHAHPWLLLFGARSGLLYWTPLLWLAVLGMPIIVRREHLGLLGWAMALGAAVNFYVASSALSWTGAAALGARVQTSLAAPFVIGIAASAGVVWRWLKRRRVKAGTALVLLLAPWIWVTWAVGTAGLPNTQVVPAPQLYGGATTHGLADIYEAVGNPWTLPATTVFALRYRAHPKVFDQVAADGMWQKHFRTLQIMTPDTFSFLSPPAHYWSEGLATLDDGTIGLRAHGKGRFLIALYWPWVTKVRIMAHPLAGPATVRIKAASFWRTRDLGTLTFASRQTQELVPPPGAFDSGINEVLVETDEPVGLDTWQWLDEAKRDTSVHLLAKKP